MSKDLIQAYKFLLDNTLSRSQEILGKKFIEKLIKKAEKITTKGGKSLLKGLDYSKKVLQLDLLNKNYDENEAGYTKEIIVETFNTLIKLIDKALSMLVGKEYAIKIINDGVQDTKLNQKDIFEKENIEDLIQRIV